MSGFLVVLLRIIAVIAGSLLAGSALRSAVQVFVLPRGVSDRVARAVFLTIAWMYALRTRRTASYEGRDRIMAFYAPTALLALTATWLGTVILGYSCILWGLGAGSVIQSFEISGSSLFTLGFATVPAASYSILVFSEAAIGLLLAALLVAYLPTIYAAWSRREAAVATLEVRAGSPPSAWELAIRYHRISGFEALNTLWPAWETWFLDIEESHTSLSALVFFRSPQPDRSWVNAAGTILDSAALFSSTIDAPRDPQRDLCLRAGYIALRRIATLFRIPYNPDPSPTDPISISREEFMAVCQILAAAGVPLRADLELAWRNFAGWRVNYDHLLLALAALTMAPYAPWISDRSMMGRGAAASPWMRLDSRLSDSRS